MSSNEAAVQVDRIELIARALRSLDTAGFIQPALPRSSAQRKPRATSQSLRGALRGLFAGESAAASNRRLKLVLARLSEAMLEGIALFGRDGEIVYANDGACQMLGRSRDELIGKRACHYFGEIDALARRGARARKARPNQRCEIELRTKGGRPLVVDVCSERIEARDGSLRGVLAVMLDITARANALRHSESETRLLSAQLVAAQELERQRIARELHDSVGQALGGVKFELETCEAQLAGEERTARTLQQLARRMQSVIEEVRRISMDLRPSTLDDLGILPTLGWFMREFSAIYGQIELNTLVDVDEDEIAAPLKTAIYRIVQEAFHNVVTHSGARRVSLVLRRRKRQLELQVQDDGAGCDTRPRGKARGGLGLATMRERAEVTGGRFALRSQPGGGTTVAVSWPLYRGKRP